MAKITWTILFLFTSHTNALWAAQNANQCRSLFRQAKRNPNGQAMKWLKNLPQCKEFVDLLDPPAEPVQMAQPVQAAQPVQTVQRPPQQQELKAVQNIRQRPKQIPQPEKIRQTQHSEMAFVAVTAGTFSMGSPDGEQKRDRAAHAQRVTLTEDFEIQTTEVTQRQYFEVMGSNPSHYKSREYCEDQHRVLERVELCPDNPVEMVSWHDVQNFLAKLNQTKNDSYTYRLPTTEEWEYAARAGTVAAYFFGDDGWNMGDYAWYSQNSRNKNRRRQTYPVGLKGPNPWGLYDLYGNVWEWVSLKTSSGELLSATRGNSYIGHTWQMRSASYTHKRTYPGRGLPVIGIRLVRTAN